MTVADPNGRLRITCPKRFQQGNVAFRWVGDEVLGNPDAKVLGEIGFLEPVALVGSDAFGEQENSAVEDRRAREVGRIDNVLVVPDVNPMQWCALEVQAVYFQGEGMSKEYSAIERHDEESIPFPVSRRQPDYRSSGPKRLMPQLQTKVPTLRRWGKKMAVVVDEDFFESLGEMRTVADISNCDIAWFVMRLDESSGVPQLSRLDVHRVTLEDAVEGLVAGKPKTLAGFEALLLEKLRRSSAVPEIDVVDAGEDGTT